MVQRIPGVPYAAAPAAEPHAAVLAWPPRLVVIHDTGNPSSNKEGEASYAHTRPVNNTTTSAHAYVDPSGPLGSLRLDRQAWSAYSYANGHGWHIEMCGMNAGDPHAVPPTTIAHTTALVRQLCQLADIPMVKLSPAQVAAGGRGICGHRDITIGLGVGTHDDPGARFDWPAFIAQVNTSQPLTAEGTDMDLDDSGSTAILPGATNRAVLRTMLGILISMLTGSRRSDLIAWSATDVPDRFWPALTGSAQREQDMLAALTAVTSGGTDVNTAAIIATVNARTADVTGLLQQQADRIAELEAELEQARRAQHAAAQATAAATEDEPAG